MKFPKRILFARPLPARVSNKKLRVPLRQTKLQGRLSEQTSSLEESEISEDAWRVRPESPGKEIPQTVELPASCAVCSRFPAIVSPTVGVDDAAV
ncbi:hypothetical protein STEG23_018655, partial [Scotinomys teguina]